MARSLFSFLIQQRDKAIRLPVPVEQAPSIAESAKRRVIPRTEDWLDRREITGP
jgi:hypothetical protein